MLFAQNSLNEDIIKGKLWDWFPQLNDPYSLDISNQALEQLICSSDCVYTWAAPLGNFFGVTNYYIEMCYYHAKSV